MDLVLYLKPTAHTAFLIIAPDQLPKTVATSVLDLTMIGTVVCRIGTPNIIAWAFCCCCCCYLRSTDWAQKEDALRRRVFTSLGRRDTMYFARQALSTQGTLPKPPGMLRSCLSFSLYLHCHHSESQKQR